MSKGFWANFAPRTISRFRAHLERSARELRTCCVTSVCMYLGTMWWIVLVIFATAVVCPSYTVIHTLLFAGLGFAAGVRALCLHAYFRLTAR